MNNANDRLQLINESLADESKQPKQIMLTKIWNWLAKQILLNDEPKIYVRQNRRGEDIWTIYDPATGYNACLGSEMEVRMWLDQRFRRR